MYAVIYYDPCKAGYELIGAYSSKSAANESLTILENDIEEGKLEAHAPGIVEIDEELKIKENTMTDKKENNYHCAYNFDNGYGASVVCNKMSYGNETGLFEVAVLKDGKICYDTEISNDVIGWCDHAEVARLLERIKNLPKAS
jgi:hypothetical protein